MYCLSKLLRQNHQNRQLRECELNLQKTNLFFPYSGYIKEEVHISDFVVKVMLTFSKEAFN